MSHWVDIGPVSALVFGPGAPFTVEGRRLAAFRHGDGYRVIDDACPHASAPLCDGAVLDGKVICHLHLWEFDLETGACDVGEEWSVQTYATRVIDGRLHVELPDT